MKLREFLGLGIALLLTPTAATLVYRLATRPTAVTKAAPTAFTLQLQERIKLGPPDDSTVGHWKISRDVTIAQRADGTRVEKEVFSPAQPSERRERTLIMPNRQHIKVWDNVGLKTTGAPWSAEAQERYHQLHRTPGSDCMLNNLGNSFAQGYRMIGKEYVGGLLTVKMQSDHSHQLTAWHAPDLDCEQVKRVIEFKGCCTAQEVNPKGLTSDTSDLQFVGFVRGEPDPALFDIASHIESSAAAANEAQLRAAGFPEAHIKRAQESWASSKRR